MRIIKLNSHMDNGGLFINVNHIVAFEGGEDCSFIYTTNDSNPFCVKETPEEIIELINESLNQ